MRSPAPASQHARVPGVPPPGIRLTSLLGAFALVVLQAHARLAPELVDRLPPPAPATVDFQKDIRPILEASCVKCHGRGKAKGGFRLDTRESFLQPGDSGPAAVPGDSRNSLLIHLVSGLDPENVMPDKGTRLTPEQVGLLRAWIDQQLPWAPHVTFAREPHRNLAPRAVEPPAPSGDSTHPVDRFIDAYLREKNLPIPTPVEDRRFARRVHLDVVGMLPTDEELKTFLADSSADRRSRLVRRLLADRSRYAQHWLTFWNDLLRNDYRGTGYIDGGREPISRWLYAALRDNLPYDRFVRELVNPGDGPARGFTKGIVWRGVVNASQTPQMQAAQNIAQVFLGVNLKCASCHDSFIDDWQLTDAYGLAGVYAESPLELVQCDKPLGRHAPVRFPFPELGGIDDTAPRPERVAQLAGLLTTNANGRLPRTLVNRLWARLMGRGLVEPLDVMQNPAWSPDLLDWLAEDFVAHGYDLKHTLETLLTSRAYQYPAVDSPDRTDAPYVFQGPLVRRLGAEQFRDSLGQLTGVWAEMPEGGLETLLAETPTNAPAPITASWIWSDPHAATAAPPQTVFFLRRFVLPNAPAEALLLVNADNEHRLWVNGRQARGRNDIPWSETGILDLRPFLAPGTNVLAVQASNGGDGPNPAGLLVYARLRGADGTSHDFASDASWWVTTNRVEGWEKKDFTLPETASPWAQAQVLGGPDIAPWNLGPRFSALAAGGFPFARIRASLVASDPLASALGRPNREQVTSARPTLATTIQMLELTNGGTLAGILRDGSRKLAERQPSGEALVRQVFELALGRSPTPAEAEIALELVGAQSQAEGVEDLLWSLAMLPEFQFLL